MPTRKIEEDSDDWNGKFSSCKHREHNPPTMRVWEPGLWEHECPSCGYKQRFYIAERSYSYANV